MHKIREKGYSSTSTLQIRKQMVQKVQESGPMVIDGTIKQSIRNSLGTPSTQMPEAIFPQSIQAKERQNDNRERRINKVL